MMPPLRWAYIGLQTCIGHVGSNTSGRRFEFGARLCAQLDGDHAQFQWACPASPKSVRHDESWRDPGAFELQGSRPGAAR